MLDSKESMAHGTNAIRVRREKLIQVPARWLGTCLGMMGDLSAFSGVVLS